MSEIGEEEISRAIALELAAFRKQMFPDSSVDILPSEHARATGVMIVVVKPALERARREERERAAEIADVAAEREDARAFEYDDDVHVAECRGAERAANAIAAAIRKGSGE